MYYMSSVSFAITTSDDTWSVSRATATIAKILSVVLMVHWISLFIVN